MAIQDLDKRITEIEEEIRKTPYHKGTEHHIGRLKARLARLKEEKFRKAGKKGGGRNGFSVRKTGDAAVILVGPPSVGKSTLINKLTRTFSKVASYDFTTTTVIPGMMDYQGAKIQIFDIPGMVTGAVEGKGRGKEVISQIRSADLIILMIDPDKLEMIEKLKKELYQAGIRLDQKPPVILINKKQKGGLKIFSTIRLSLSRETIQKIVKEFRLENAELVIREDITMERLIDALTGNRIYLPYLVVINKIDQLSLRKLERLKSQFAVQKALFIAEHQTLFIAEHQTLFIAEHQTLFISCHKNLGLEELKEAIWQELGLIRVYLKKKKQEPDFQLPSILKKNKSLKDLLEQISICEKNDFTVAKIFGPGAKYPGQEVSLDFQPQDGEIVSFV